MSAATQRLSDQRNVAKRAVTSSAPVKLPFFTIGHSNRPLEEFGGLLIASEISFVADIRKLPTSKANPQFNIDTLPGALAAFQISYEHIAALGGLRGKARNLPSDVNGFWTNESFHNYADYALSEPFSRWFGSPAQQGMPTTLRDNVFGSSVVAMPPPHRG